jgi:ABC-type Zn uptake system ZnuABC Zn-binding protein ZnuA
VLVTLLTHRLSFPSRDWAYPTRADHSSESQGGDKVKVTQILKPNVDPHDYEPSPADVQAIAEADVVVESGVHLEKWLNQTIESAGFHGTLVDSSKGVPVRQGNGTGEEAAGDPHIWHNPKNAEIMSRDIAAAFSAKDAKDKAAFDANLTAYNGELDRLDTWIAQQVGTVPADRRKLVTNHDAFGYYVDRPIRRYRPISTTWPTSRSTASTRSASRPCWTRSARSRNAARQS